MALEDILQGRHRTSSFTDLLAFVHAAGAPGTVCCYFSLALKAMVLWLVSAYLSDMKWDGDGRRAVMQELAEEARTDGQFFFYVRIPGNIQPLERGECFESPLDAALQEAEIGSVTGGGSQLGDGDTIEYCGIDVVASCRERALGVIRQVLQKARCPRDTVIEEYLPEYQEIPIWSN